MVQRCDSSDCQSQARPDARTGRRGAPTSGQLLRLDGRRFPAGLLGFGLPAPFFGSGQDAGIFRRSQLSASSAAASLRACSAAACVSRPRCAPLPLPAAALGLDLRFLLLARSRAASCWRANCCAGRAREAIDIGGQVQRFLVIGTRADLVSHGLRRPGPARQGRYRISRLRMASL